MNFYIPEHPFAFNLNNVPREKVKYYSRLAGQEVASYDRHFENDPVLVERAQASVKQWKEIAESNDQTLDDRIFWDAQFGIQALLVRADGHSDKAVRMLQMLADALLDGLFAVTANDEKPVAQLWFRALTRSTINLNSLLYQRTDIFLPALKEECSVPSIISPSPISTENNETLLDRLEKYGLGTGANAGMPKVKKGRGNRFSYKKKDNLLALNLYAHMNEARARWKMWTRLTDTTKAELHLKEYTTPWLAAAITLEPFHPKNSESWFGVAWQIVMEATNDKPESEPSLISILTEHERKQSVTLAVGIERKLRGAFRAMAMACH